MQSADLRQKFLDFFAANGHAMVASSSLLPTDPSVLFTTAGMQQFKPYYLGEKSPWGLNAASCQKCIRTSDIEEVGDERHLTFFEMLGNFSFGGYWKKEAITLAHKFVVEELKLEIDYVTVFEGLGVVPFDQESYDIWKGLGVPESKIKKFGMHDNFWGPTGNGGPCGPTTEIYVNGVEIWNLVFNEFYFPGSREELLAGNSGKQLEKLQIQGIDTGMGLERLAAVVQGVPTVFETDLFASLMDAIPHGFDEKKKRVFADHARAIAFLLSDGARPSNKDQGYILRRLIRRVLAEEFLAKKYFFEELLALVVSGYRGIYAELNWETIKTEFLAEKDKFSSTLEHGMAELKKMQSMDVKSAFLLFQSYGLPYDVIKDFAPTVSQQDFEAELKKHQDLSRTAGAGMFKGGLADHEPRTIRLHTAHHVLLAVLQELFGKQVKQRGSNITQERLRIDFSFDRKLTDAEKKQVEGRVNEKIAEGLAVVKREMPKEEAEKIGAESEFGVKYGNTVSVYFIESSDGSAFSKEFCGGPHVANTAEIGKFKILKEEAVSAGVRRIKATVE